MTHKFAKYLILATSALGLSALPAFATTCAGGETVTTGFTCSLGGLTFNFLNVAFTPPGGPPLPPSLALNSLTGISGNDYILDFSVSVGTPPSTDLLLDYTVTGGSFTQVDNGYLVNGSTPPNQDLTENVYDYSTGTKGSLLAVLKNTTGADTFSGTFGPVSAVYIAKDFNNVSSEFNDSIVSTPEPSSLGFMLMGIFGIGWVSRKFRRA